MVERFGDLPEKRRDRDKPPKRRAIAFMVRGRRQLRLRVSWLRESVNRERRRWNQVVDLAGRN